MVRRTELGPGAHDACFADDFFAGSCDGNRVVSSDYKYIGQRWWKYLFIVTSVLGQDSALLLYSI